MATHLQQIGVRHDSTGDLIIQTRQYNSKFWIVELELGQTNSFLVRGIDYLDSPSVELSVQPIRSELSGGTTGNIGFDTPADFVTPQNYVRATKPDGAVYFYYQLGAVPAPTTSAPSPAPTTPAPSSAPTTPAPTVVPSTPAPSPAPAPLTPITPSNNSLLLFAQTEKERKQKNWIIAGIGFVIVAVASIFVWKYKK